MNRSYLYAGPLLDISKFVTSLLGFLLFSSSFLLRLTMHNKLVPTTLAPQQDPQALQFYGNKQDFDIKLDRDNI